MLPVMKPLDIESSYLLSENSKYDSGFKYQIFLYFYCQYRADFEIKKLLKKKLSSLVLN